MEALARAAYEALAESYAALIDTKPHNAFYERPATLKLLGDVQGKHVFDAGCGPGVYSEWLLAEGATVVAGDVSPSMLKHARKRLGERVELHEINLAEPLPLRDASFDIVVCALVLEYIYDWAAVFREFARILKPNGMVVYSVTHPFFDYTYHASQAYFNIEQCGAWWSSFPPQKVYMPTYRRSLSDTINPALQAGFIVEALVEPLPTDEFRQADPQHYTELQQFPVFLCIRIKKV